MRYLLLLISVVILWSCSTIDSVTQPQIEPSQEPQRVSWDTILTLDTSLTPETMKPQQSCILFDDFSDPSDTRWGVVNDWVMWGRSQGSTKLVDDTLVFAWTIVTRWGGFSSLRAGLESWILSKYNSVKLRAKSDGREYRITFRDAQWGNISHRAVLDFQSPWEFEELTINFSDLQPAYFGRSVKADPFEKESAREIGVILSDGVDWEFELVIDEVRFCN